MAKFWVWDPDGESEEHALVIDAFDAGSAAEHYAEHDIDGGIAGLYATPGRKLRVRDEAGNIVTVQVLVECEPNYYATIV